MIMLALAAASAQSGGFAPWARFSRDRMASEVVEVATLFGTNTGRLEYRLRLTTRRFRHRKPEIRWADSITCPAVRTVVLGMDNLAIPTPAALGGRHENKVVILDGTDYALTVPSTYAMGNLTVTSTDGSPLADWVDSAFRQLAPCWRPTENG